MRAVVRRLGSLAVALLLTRCERPRTEIVVRVTSDVAWGEGQALQSVVLTIRRGGSSGILRSVRTTALGAGPGRRALPLYISVIPSDDDVSTPVWIEAIGCDAVSGCTSSTLVQRALVTFGREQTLELDLGLYGVCRGSQCSAEQWCPQTGRCAPATQAPLRLFTGLLPPGLPDASRIDASEVESGRTDAIDVPRADIIDASTPDIAAAPRMDVIDASAPDITDVPRADLMDAPRADVVDSSTADIVDVRRADAADATMIAPQRSCAAAPGATGCGVVVIPGGTITMGSNAPSCPVTGPDRDTCIYQASPAIPNVRVSRFTLDRDEVTVARFRAFWQAGHPAPTGPIQYPGGSLRYTGAVQGEAELRSPTGGPPVLPSCNWNATDREDHPINCVDWFTAQAFCAWDSPGGRLPTEAEWELAARGTEARVHPWGAAAADGTRACWGEPMARSSTCVVGALAAGATPVTGVRDMAGNVSEWLADLYLGYADGRCWNPAGMTDPVCAISGAIRAYRGGGWSHNSYWYLRSGSRDYGNDTVRSTGVGFRCARSN